MIFSFLLAIGGVLEPAPALPCRGIIKLLTRLTKELASQMGNDLILLLWTQEERAQCPSWNEKKPQST